MSNTMATLTAQEKAEIIELYRTGEPLKNIAEAFHIELSGMSIISKMAKAAGCKPRKVLVHRTKAGATTPEEELAQLKKREAELQEQIEHRQLAVERVDDTTVEIRGVTAHFLKLGGMVKVREYITKHIPQTGVESTRPCPHCNGRGQV